MSEGPLVGVKVIEMGQLIAGPFCGQLLGDMGADVVKIEAPGRGDPMRQWGQKGYPLFWEILGRNKRTVSIDLRQPAGQDLARRLIGGADILIENFRPGALEGWNLAPNDLRKADHRLIVVRISGYGQTGPYADRAGFGLIGEAMGGWRHIVGDPDRPPSRMGVSIGDSLAATFGCLGALAALHHREKTGEGQFVEVPMFECLTSFNLAEHMFGHVFDPPTGQWAYSRVANPNRKPFATVDGYIGLLPYNDKQWVAFFEAAGFGHHMQDARFNTQKARSENYHALYGLIEDITRTKTTAAWLALLKPLHIPVTKTNRLDDLMDDPHLKAVGFFERFEHPDAGPYFNMKPPLKFSATPANVRRHPPRLGEHTAEIMED